MKTEKRIPRILLPIIKGVRQFQPFASYKIAEVSEQRPLLRYRDPPHERVAKASGEWGYSQREVADYLRLHYSTLSRIIKEREKSTNKT